MPKIIDNKIKKVIEIDLKVSVLIENIVVIFNKIPHFLYLGKSKFWLG
jgi:hypothetical protein